jgi:hypothetical protein
MSNKFGMLGPTDGGAGSLALAVVDYGLGRHVFTRECATTFGTRLNHAITGSAAAASTARLLCCVQR